MSDDILGWLWIIAASAYPAGYFSRIWIESRRKHPISARPRPPKPRHHRPRKQH